MATDPQTEAMLEALTDAISLAHLVARGAVAGPGTENGRDAAKYLEDAVLDLLRDRGETAQRLAHAVGCDVAANTPWEVLGRVDWLVVGEEFWARYADELGCW